MRTPQGKVATAFFAYSGRMLAEIAAILGKEDDAAYYSKTAEMAKKAWRFIATEDGKISSDRQADYVRALAFGLLDGDEARQAAADLNELVKKLWISFKYRIFIYPESDKGTVVITDMRILHISC